jgi:hypothetical protein
MLIAMAIFVRLDPELDKEFRARNSIHDYAELTAMFRKNEPHSWHHIKQKKED